MENPRNERAKRYELLEILVIRVLATICEADNSFAMAVFGLANPAWLLTFLPLPNGIPSHDTVRRVLARLDAGQFSELGAVGYCADPEPTGSF